MTCVLRPSHPSFSLLSNHLRYKKGSGVALAYLRASTTASRMIWAQIDDSYCCISANHQAPDQCAFYMQDGTPREPQ